jgi:hypothetical protein
MAMAIQATLPDRPRLSDRIVPLKEIDRASMEILPSLAHLPLEESKARGYQKGAKGDRRIFQP